MTDEKKLGNSKNYKSVKKKKDRTKRVQFFYQALFLYIMGKVAEWLKHIK